LPEKEGRLQIVRNLISQQKNELTEEEIDYLADLTDGKIK
jgi:hypothetical protein